MTGKERVRAAMRREYADKVPVSFPIQFHAPRLAGYTIKEVMTDSDKAVMAMKKAYETFHPDVIVCVQLSADIFAGPLGGQWEFDHEGIHAKGELLKDPKDLTKLTIPDLEKCERLPYYIDVCNRVREEIQDAAVGASSIGPWVLACMLRGTEQLLSDTFDSPFFVHDLMRFTTDWTNSVNMAIARTGVGLTISEPSAGCSVISPKIYREFIKPYHREVVDFFKQKKIGISFHICGRLDPIMEDIVEVGPNSLSIDAPSSLERLVEISKKKCVIIGNVSTDLFLRGTKEEIEKEVKRCIDTAAKGGAYILCPGCGIPPNAPVENIHYFMEARDKYGSYEYVSSL